MRVKQLMIALLTAGALWLGAGEASAQVANYNCNTERTVDIYGASGGTTVGATAGHYAPAYMTGTEFPCFSNRTEVEVWMDGNPGCKDGQGYFTGSACMVISDEVYASATVERTVGAVWGTWTAGAKYYLIRRTEPYNHWWLYQGEKTDSRNFGQPPTPPGDFELCQMDPETGVQTCEGGGNSPIVINIGKSNRYELSSAADGVAFDINGDGVAEQVAWPVDPDVVFLALDRDGDGVITSGRELFGDSTVQGSTNGFHALQVLVENNGDGVITAADSQFSRLLLWSDANRNGVSEASELTPASQRIAKIGLGYTEVGRRDQHGNALRYKGYAVTIEDAGASAHLDHAHDRQRPIYDVFFKVQQ